MSATDPAEAQRRLAAEFERNGWEYDLTVGRSIVDAAQRRGSANPGDLARLVTADFLKRNATTRDEVAAAIQDALGGHVVGQSDQPAKVTINKQTYLVDLGGATISHSNINIGPGTQINIDASAAKDDVLGAVAAVVASGLAGHWNPEAAAELASMIEGRDDIDYDDVVEATAEVVDTEQPSQGRVKEMLRAIAVSGLGGALATGISAALGAAI